MGLKGSPTTDIYCDECVIPADRIIGELRDARCRSWCLLDPCALLRRTTRTSSFGTLDPSMSSGTSNSSLIMSRSTSGSPYNTSPTLR
jgi:hypothetical protein